MSGGLGRLLPRGDGRLAILLFCAQFPAAVATHAQGVREEGAASARQAVSSAGAPVVRAMSDLRIAATIPIAKTADWVAITPDGVWVGGTGPNSVSLVNPATNGVTRVDLPGRPCAGLAADALSLWVPLCGPVPRLAKVDLKTQSLSRVFEIGPAAPEGGIAIGAGSLWLVTDKAGSLARIDPASGAIVQNIQLPAGSYNPGFGDGLVWVTRVDGAELTVVDPRTGTVVGRVATGQHPRFVASRPGSIWTLNQLDGSLSHIDTLTYIAAPPLPLGTPGSGGDITIADGRVWTTMMATPLTAVDARTGAILCQWKGDGGDSLGIGHGAIWLTNLREGTVSRIELADVPAACAAAGETTGTTTDDGTAPLVGAPRFSKWIDGTSATEPEMQVQTVDADTFVIRQSIRTDFEAPFLYLLFGHDRALLLDSGAGGLLIRPTVDRLIDAWRKRHSDRLIHLIVAHSHSHGDHHAGDDEFRARPDTEVVGLAPVMVAAFFHVANWPHDLGSYDLGGRILDVIPTPGHEPSHIMVYDRRTKLLFSGDMLYPGRLYVPSDRFAEFRASAERVAAFAATHPIRALLGAHIEMTSSPGQDYPMRAPIHASEHLLPLPPAAIGELQQALNSAGPTPAVDRHSDFIIYPRPSKPGP